MHPQQSQGRSRSRVPINLFEEVETPVASFVNYEMKTDRWKSLKRDTKHLSRFTKSVSGYSLWEVYEDILVTDELYIWL